MSRDRTPSLTWPDWAWPQRRPNPDSDRSAKITDQYLIRSLCSVWMSISALSTVEHLFSTNVSFLCHTIRQSVVFVCVLLNMCLSLLVPSDWTELTSLKVQIPQHTIKPQPSPKLQLRLARNTQRFPWTPSTWRLRRPCWDLRAKVKPKVCQYSGLIRDSLLNWHICKYGNGTNRVHRKSNLPFHEMAVICYAQICILITINYVIWWLERGIGNYPSQISVSQTKRKLWSILWHGHVILLRAALVLLGDADCELRWIDMPGMM